MPEQAKPVTTDANADVVVKDGITWKRCADKTGSKGQPHYTGTVTKPEPVRSTESVRRLKGYEDSVYG